MPVPIEKREVPEAAESIFLSSPASDVSNVVMEREDEFLAGGTLLVTI